MIANEHVYAAVLNSQDAHSYIFWMRYSIQYRTVDRGIFCKVHDNHLTLIRLDIWISSEARVTYDLGYPTPRVPKTQKSQVWYHPEKAILSLWTSTLANTRNQVFGAPQTPATSRSVKTVKPNIMRIPISKGANQRSGLGMESTSLPWFGGKIFSEVSEVIKLTVPYGVMIFSPTAVLCTPTLHKYSRREVILRDRHRFYMMLS